MMADCQVAVLDHKVTLRKEPCCGADRSHHHGLGLSTFGILFHERDTFLVQVSAYVSLSARSSPILTELPQEFLALM